MDEFVIIPKGADGYYHPRNENEIIALVKYAANSKRQIRVRGASHSTAWSIFTDPVDGKPSNRTLTRRPPAGPNLDLSLDQMIALDWIDEANGIVEAEAGIHLGADPYDPLAVATLDNSLLYQLFQKGWGINDLGGITHQTVGGFLGTGSAGGSLKFDLDNVMAFRIIDGTGTPSWVERADPIFGAVAVSMGLLGIVTKVRLRCNRTFTIAGQEVTTPVTQPECPIDLFGPGTAAKPSMRQFLEEQDYSRILWWPQKGAERVVIWEAARHDAPPPPDYKPVPYQEFATDLAGWAEQLLGSIFYVLLGNKGLGRIVAILMRNYVRFCHCIARMWSATLGPIAWVPAVIVTVILWVLLLLPTLIFMIPGVAQKLFPTMLNIFQPMSDGKPKPFDDYYWRSLPMDNTADDILMGTEFTEIWMPLKYTEQCMDLLNQMFIDKGESATGYFSAEIYATMPSTAWLSPAYSDGADEYKDGVVRFDIFWYRENEGEPNVEGGFYQQYWDLFRSHGIPFRFHWGKYIPAYNFPDWAAYIRAGLPKFDDFMALRAARDPNNIFYTQYYRERFTGHA